MFKTIAEVQAAKPEIFPSGDYMFSLPKGWDGIMLDVFNCLAGTRTYHKNEEYSGLDALRLLQVKEKFANLRVYFKFDPNEDAPTHMTGAIRGAFQMAEYLSSVTCQDCGVRDDTVTKKASSRGWLGTRCDTCFAMHTP